MFVDLWSINQTTREKTHVAVCHIAECYPDDVTAQRAAVDALIEDGFLYEGGGAAELFLIARRDDVCPICGRVVLDQPHTADCDFWNGG